RQDPCRRPLRERYARREDVLAVEVPGDPQPPPTRPTPARPRRPDRSAIEAGPAARGGGADMNRRRFLLSSLAAAVAAPLAVEAPQAGNVGPGGICTQQACD